MLRAAVFVIDDQLVQARLTAELLRSWGHDVVIETNGNRALSILRGPTEFDVTFLDILMPDKTGGEIYVDLKRSAPARLKRLVFLTGMGLLADEWLAKTGLPVIEKGRPDIPEILAKTVQQFAALSCVRGPRDDEARDKVTDERRDEGNKPPMPSAHDLRKLLSQNAEEDDDDDDGADDTGVFIEKLEKHRSSSYRGSGDGASEGRNNDDMTFAVVEYLHKKHGRLTKRVGKIEKKIDHATWTIITAGAIGSLLVSILYKVFEKFVLKQ